MKNILKRAVGALAGAWANPSISYSLRKILTALPLLFSVMALSFLLVRLAPGSPFDKEAELPSEVRESLRQTYGLDQPLHLQFWNYMSGVVQGEFGLSFTYREKAVSDILMQAFPVSALLGACSILFALVFGVLLGTVSAMRPHSFVDYVTRVLAAAGKSVPPMVLAPFLVFVFAVVLQLLPVAGWSEGSLLDMILPIACLGLYDAAAIARLARGALLETLGTQRYAFLRARGIPPWRIYTVHALREVMIPLVNYLAPALSGVLIGTVVVEQVFNIPGLGRYLVSAASNRDYTLVLGIVWLSSCLIIGFNLLADLAVGFLDPRIRLK